MRIYFSGIGGVGIGPLAEIAQDAGHQVIGSDREESPMLQALRQKGITCTTIQDGSFLAEQHQAAPIDWFVYTSALPVSHPELILARQLGIHTAKRDELLAYIIAEKKLTLIAVAGTHGKTTTTGMLLWVARAVGMPVSYSVGAPLSWGPSGHYEPGSRYFLYECDEFDRNFLHFSPELSLIPSLEYDHPDTYPTPKDYTEAFRQFARQSAKLITWDSYRSTFGEPATITYLSVSDPSLTLAGEHTRRNASLVLAGSTQLGWPTDAAIEALNHFPGTGRRFEKLSENLYSDYGHTPTEIAATLQMARELSDHVVLVYQPHQNVRQHEILNQYTDAIFNDAETIYWLPTYLSREDPALEILSPHHLTQHLTTEKLTLSELDDELWSAISHHRDAGHLVLCMGAGTIDSWVRRQLST